MSGAMDDQAFDEALVRAAFDLAGETGWRDLRVAEAARRAGLPLDRARERFPSPLVVLARFGQLADKAALRHAPAQGPERDRLFDALMHRYEFLEAHRAGVQALLRRLPLDPLLALLLHRSTRRSMEWMLEAAGISTGGLEGFLRVQALVGVWLWVLRSWDRDTSEDLSATMSALDKALARAESLAGALRGLPRGAAETADDSGDVSMEGLEDVVEPADVAPPPANPGTPPGLPL